MAPTTPTSSDPRKRRVASPGSGVKTPTLPRESAIPETTPQGPLDGDKHDSNAPSDKLNTVFLQDSGLLRLPSELVEIIASELLGTADLLNLGLANKRICGIVQKTMVRHLIVSRSNVRGFLRMLSHHPELISSVCSVDLGDFGCGQYNGSLGVSMKSLDPDILKALGIAISTTTGHIVNWNEIRENNMSVGPVWKKELAFSLDVLATSCPSIKSVTVQLPEARPFSSSQPPRPTQRAPLNFPALNPELLPVAPLQGTALKLFQARLEALTITENTRWKGPPTVEVLESHNLKWRNMGSHLVTLANFTRLKRLSVPMDILGRPNDIVFSNTSTTITGKHDVAASVDSAPRIGKTLAELRSKALPLSIQYLHLRSCNKWTFALLQKINEVPVNDLRLKHVKLSFETLSKHLIIQCDAEDRGQLDYLRLLTDLDGKGVKVTFHTGPRETLVDMREELDAMSSLNPFEIWRCGGSYMPFSAWNSEASERRRRLTTGFRSFLRHADHHSQLLNSPTLNLKLWTDSALFHGIKNSKWDPQLQDPNKKVKTIDPSGWDGRALGKRAFKRRQSHLLNLDTFQFGFCIEQKISSPPKETLFLGASFTIAESTSAQPPDQHRDAAKKPRVKEEPAKRLKQADRTGSLFQTTKVQSLENDIEQLQLGSANNIPTTSGFSATQWASVAWTVFLLPKKTACNLDRWN